MPMHGSNAKLVPVGGKMNDASYPFRGEYRLDDVINHGHSGIRKKAPTSLAFSVTGSNLVIEQLSAGKGTELACELGVDGGIARPVALDAGSKMALAVPGDGRSYNLTAVIKNEAAKHYCRMTFNGSEGKSFLRVRAPELPQPDVAYIVVDGKRLRPSAGWYCIPLSASECSLMVNLPDSPRGQWPGYQEQQNALLKTPRRASLPALSPPDTPTNFILETVAGVNEKAVLQCTATGQLIVLTSNEAATVPSNGGPFRLQLPAVSAAPPAAVPALATTPAPTTPAATTASEAVPEIETRVNSNAGGGMPSFVVTCRGYQVQLTADNGATVAGLGSATLPLPNRSAQRVRIAISDNAGKVLIRQTSFVPSMQAAAINLRLIEDPSGMSVMGNDRTTFTVGTVKSTGNSGARVNRGMLQRVVVEQVHMDGSASGVTLDIGARPSTYTPPGATSGAAPATPGGVKPEDQWLANLQQVLQAPNMDEARRLMQNVRAPNPMASTLVAFVSDTLFKAPPTISFLAQRDVLQAIQCPGFNITATVQSQPPCLIAANSTVQVPPTGNVVITAVNSKNGRSVAACNVRLGQQTASQPAQPLGHSGSFPSAPAPVGTAASVFGGSDGDAQLVARTLDCVQRNNMDPIRVADELAGVNTAGYTPSGQRLVPLLVNTLRRAMQPDGGAVKEALHFTCGNGFLDNIYTDHPHYQLSAFIDNQPGSVSVNQRGRVPTQGALIGEQPHFVRLVARDPITGAVKCETTATVLGQVVASQVQQQPRQDFSPQQQPVLSPFDQTQQPQNQQHPYLDLALQPQGAEVQVRLTCAPAYRIVCGVDGGAGGDTGRNDVATRLASSRPHRVEISLLDAYGKIAFQQKVDIPAMAAPTWGLAIQDSGISVDPPLGGGGATTVSVDRAVERTIQNNFVPLDTAGGPKYVLLRRYTDAGLQGGSASELGLRLPGFMSPRELEALVSLYKAYATGQMDAGRLKSEMCTLRDRATCPPVRDLITLLLDTWLRQIQPDATGRAQRQSAELTQDQNYVYFRLTGA